MTPGIDAEQRARLGLLAVGRDQELAAQHSCVAQTHRDVGIRGADGVESGLDQHRAGGPRCLQTLPLQDAPIDDVPKIRLADFRAVEAERCPPAGFTVRVPNAHALVREQPLCRQRIPHAARFEQALRRAAQGEHPHIPISVGGRRRAQPIRDDGNPSGCAQFARHEQARHDGADYAGAHDDHVEVAPARGAHCNATPRARFGIRVRPPPPARKEDNPAFPGGNRSNANRPILRSRRTTLEGLANRRTRPSVNARTPARSAARHASYSASKLAAPASNGGSRRCSARSSARLATSRNPRLKPMPATGCRLWAALPMMTQRSALVRSARVSDNGYGTRRPTLRKRPRRKPKRRCTSARNSTSDHAMADSAAARLTVSTRAQRPPSSGSRASGPPAQNRSYATWSWKR